MVFSIILAMTLVCFFGSMGMIIESIRLKFKSHLIHDKEHYTYNDEAIIPIIISTVIVSVLIYTFT